ncbi:MAG: hypothetical protein KIS92_24845 [Planctomycetota bacterium]|nr:hypothetical protein [Planctomycetota bacterium]
MNFAAKGFAMCEHSIGLTYLTLSLALLLWGALMLRALGRSCRRGCRRSFQAHT